MATYKTITHFGSIIKKVAESNKIKESEVSRLLKWMQIYEYRGSRFLTFFDEYRAEQLLHIRNNPKELTKMLRFYSLNDHLREKERKIKENEEIQRDFLFSKKQELFDKGLNVYGRKFMSLHYNIARDNESFNLHHSGKLCATMRLDDSPQIVFDLSQLWANERISNVKRVIKQMSDIYYENKLSRDPWQIHYVGCNTDKFVETQFKKAFSVYCAKHLEQHILPIRDTRLPHEYIPKDKKVVYLSLMSKKFLDGPINADYYVINANMDNRGESKIMGRRAGAETYAIPLKKYINWNGSPMFIPFLNTYKILKQVYQNGGDWREALYDNISKKYIDREIRELPYNKIRHQKAKFVEEEMKEIIELMKSVH
uniref:SAM-dependent MTase TRM10-type domain-containing protein n=1 Tax=Strongyloides venezuelensis TaxID=75913 RepID=A0A0K0EU73_STRVS